MSNEELFESIKARVMHHLTEMDIHEIPGSVMVEIHRDTSQVRKVNVTVSEAWPIRQAQIRS